MKIRYKCFIIIIIYCYYYYYCYCYYYYYYYMYLLKSIHFLFLSLFLFLFFIINFVQYEFENEKDSREREWEWEWEWERGEDVGCCFILLSRKSVVVRTFLTVCELMYGPCDALESTAMTTPLLKMKPSVVVPWLGCTSRIVSAVKEDSDDGETSGTEKHRRFWEDVEPDADADADVAPEDEEGRQPLSLLLLLLLLLLLPK